MSENQDDVQAVEKLGEARDAIVAELRKAIVGMDDVIDEMMIAIFAQGHCLLVGVPGLAKTLLVSSLAQTLSLSFKPSGSVAVKVIVSLPVQSGCGTTTVATRSSLMPTDRSTFPLYVQVMSELALSRSDTYSSRLMLSNAPPSFIF